MGTQRVAETYLKGYDEGVTDICTTLAAAADRDPLTGDQIRRMLFEYLARVAEVKIK